MYNYRQTNLMYSHYIHHHHNYHYHMNCSAFDRRTMNANVTHHLDCPSRWWAPLSSHCFVLTIWRGSLNGLAVVSACQRSLASSSVVHDRPNLNCLAMNRHWGCCHSIECDFGQLNRHVHPAAHVNQKYKIIKTQVPAMYEAFGSAWDVKQPN